MKRKVLNLGVAALFVFCITTITSCGSTEQKQEHETHEHEEGEDEHHEHEEGEDEHHEHEEGEDEHHEHEEVE